MIVKDAVPPLVSAPARPSRKVRQIHLFMARDTSVASAWGRARCHLLLRPSLHRQPRVWGWLCTRPWSRIVCAVPPCSLRGGIVRALSPRHADEGPSAPYADGTSQASDGEYPS